MDVGKDAVVMEVKEGAVEGDVHDCLLAEGVSANRFLLYADISRAFTTLAALHIEIPRTGEWVLVHRRTQNDLPAEVLGSGCWILSRDDQESGYVIDNPRTAQQIPVEF